MTGYARYIGRVGALAVALGVGGAVAGGHGLAWADTTGSAVSDASTTSSPPCGDTAAAGGTPVTAVDDSVSAASPSVAALLPELHKLPGFSGGLLLSRDESGLVELTTHTLWESLEAVRAFAGDDITTAVVEPDALALLLESDRTVVHRTVLVDARS